MVLPACPPTCRPAVLVLVMLLQQENLRLSPAMLSRFDVIFVLLDRPDELMDQALSEHIMALHSGKTHARRCGRPYREAQLLGCIELPCYPLPPTPPQPLSLCKCVFNPWVHPPSMRLHWECAWQYHHF